MTEDEQRHNQHDLGARVTHGVGWVLASQVPVQVFGLITSVVIARILGPFEVGLAAEALVFTSLALIFADFGFAAVIIQRPALTEADKSTAFWVGAALGTVLMLVGIGLSWPIAALYGEPEVQPLFAALSAAFLFSALGIVQGALLVRDLRFRSLEIRTIVATGVSCAVGIAAAAAGAGAWAIVAQHLVIVAVSTALLWGASSWRPRAIFSRTSLHEMAGYSTHVFGTEVLGWATTSLDNFLIGRYLGASDLGAYSIAYSVMTTPIKRVVSPLSRVFFPAFSAMGDRARIAAAWLRGSRMVAVVIVPVTLGMIPIAPDLVLGVFGDEWELVIPLVQILAVVGLVQSLAGLCDGLLQAIAHTRELFRFTLGLSIASVASFAAGLPFGVEGVAVAFLAVNLILQPVLIRLTAHGLGIRAAAWYRAVSGAVVAGGLMLIPVFAARELLAPNAGHGVRLAIMVGVGALAYLPLLRLLVPEALDEVAQVRRRRAAARAVAEEAG